MGNTGRHDRQKLNFSSTKITVVTKLWWMVTLPMTLIETTNLGSVTFVACLGAFVADSGPFSIVKRPQLGYAISVIVLGTGMPKPLTLCLWLWWTRACNNYVTYLGSLDDGQQRGNCASNHVAQTSPN